MVGCCPLCHTCVLSTRRYCAGAKGSSLFSKILRFHRRTARGRTVRIAGLVALGALLLAAPATQAAVPLTEVITDPFTNAHSQHATAVEPDTFALGNTIIAVSQVGRGFNGGASGTGFATSTNGGATWTERRAAGPDSASGPARPVRPRQRPGDRLRPQAQRLARAVAGADPDTIVGTFPVGIVVNRSTDGGLTWSNPIVSVDAPAEGARQELDRLRQPTRPARSTAAATQTWDDNGFGDCCCR